MRLDGLLEQAMRLARTEGLNPLHGTRLAINRRSQPGPARRLELRPLFSLILSGEKRVHTAWKTYSFAPASVLVTSARTPSVSRIVTASPRKPYLSIILELDPAIVAPVVEARRELPVRGITTLAEVSEDVLALVGELLAGRSEAEPALMAHLANSEHALTMRAVAARAYRDELVVAALGQIAERVEQPLSVESLAACLGTSASTLHHRFKARTGTSPLQFHKRVRLERARELMRLFAWTAEHTAHEVGYASAAQFSRDYRRQFGAPPRRDRSAV